jgi:hypothetical protein
MPRKAGNKTAVWREDDPTTVKRRRRSREKNYAAKGESYKRVIGDRRGGGRAAVGGTRDATATRILPDAGICMVVRLNGQTPGRTDVRPG